MIEKQKTWVDILGMDTSNVVVHGCYLSKQVGPERFQTLYTFENQQYAERALEIWKLQVQIAVLERSPFYCDACGMAHDPLDPTCRKGRRFS